MPTELLLAGALVALGGGRFTPADVAVRDGVITAVGPDAARTLSPSARRYDASGGTLVPGFGDAHAHPLVAGLERLHAPVRGARTVAEIQQRVAAHAAAHPEKPWIYGEGFELTLADQGRFHASWLDEAVPDRPVALRANDIHTVWCNTAALRLAGLTEDTPDPVDGWIDRDEDGAPLGTLREWGAFLPVLDLVPAPDRAAKAAALRTAAHTLASAGVTWVQDAWVEASDVPAYIDAARAEDFPLRMNIALRADPRRWRDQRAEFRRAREAVAASAAAGSLTVRTVKFFVDGIIESGTASLLAPYDDRPGCCGLPNWPAAELAEAVRAFDADGFQAHIHAMGDAAVRLSLDVVEAAGHANGPRDRRPVLTHLQLVDPADLPRLAALGATACFQPVWAQEDALMTRLTLPRLGGGAGSRQYPIASVLASGANVAFASDWPITRHEPLAGMAVATTRADADGLPHGGWTPHERTDLAQALDAYTLGAAHQAFEEERWGALRPGMRADIVHLGADLPTVPPAALRDVPVVRTWLGGRVTHDARYR